MGTFNMHRPRTAVATVVVVTLLAGATAVLAHATVPGKNGRIAFKRYLDSPRSTGAIFTIDANGTAERQVTKPEPGVVDDQPDWSPDGKLILFRSNAGGAAQSQIYVVRPNGSDVRPLTCFKPGTTVLSYSFSADGKWITFAKSGRGGEPDIFVMRANGADIRPVTRSALWDSAPDWGAAG